MPGTASNRRAAALLLAALVQSSLAPSAHAGDPGMPLRVGTAGGNAIHRTQTIRGEQGGMLVAGRFWLWVPAGAWPGSAEVSLTVPETGRLVADVDVDPVPAGGFATPIHLFVGLADARDLRTASVASWDAARQVWIPFQAVARDTDKRELQVVLSQPARCAVLAPGAQAR